MKKIVVITGVSGSGKTSAIKVLEDLGFFCVDNLPVELFPKFLELAEKRDLDVALGLDVRSQLIGGDFSNLLTSLKGRIEVLFIEARKEILIRRFNETRRKHPMREVKSVTEGIEKELQWIESIRQHATDIIDTSHLTVHDLKNLIQKRYGSQEQRLRVNIISFGYRHGLPLDADIVMDTRCLPNPYYEENLRDFTGNDQVVIDYFKKAPTVMNLLKHYYSLFDELLPLYEKEGKSYLTIGIGCTAGRHRSVYIASQLIDFFKKKGFEAHLNDRDINKS